MTEERKLNKYRFVIAVMVDAEGVDGVDAYHVVERAWLDRQPVMQELTWHQTYQDKLLKRVAKIKRIAHVSTALVEAEEVVEENERLHERIAELTAELEKERNRPITVEEALKRINVAAEEIIRRKVSKGQL